MHDLSVSPVKVGILAPSLVCWGLERLVQTRHPHMELAMTWSNIRDALTIAPPVACDVIVMDLGADECLETISTMRAATTACLLLVTGSTNLAFLDQAVLGGARGVVQRAESPASLLKAIERVSHGEYWINRAAIGRIFLDIARQHDAPAAVEPERQRIASLTPRERKTIAALMSDASAQGKAVARRLCISEHTLRNHLTAIYQKLGLVNRVDLYAFAMRNGLGEPGEAPKLHLRQLQLPPPDPDVARGRA